jgi:hypothetical protein
MEVETSAIVIKENIQSVTDTILDREQTDSNTTSREETPVQMNITTPKDSDDEDAEKRSYVYDTDTESDAVSQDEKPHGLTLTLFGRLWTFLDHLCTIQTRHFLRNGEAESIGTPVEMTRKEIFSENILKAYPTTHTLTLDTV